FEDYLVPNAPAGAGSLAIPIGWIPGSQGEDWGSNPGNIVEDIYRTNCLGPYVSNVKVYKCPNDNLPSDNGDRIRSISMNAARIGYLYRMAGQGIFDQVTGYLNGWKYFEKMSDLNCLKPAEAWVFCDESMYSLNDGFLQCSLDKPDYPDVPAAY